MRKTSIAAAIAAIVFAIAATAAPGVASQGAHFIKAHTGASSDGFSLTVWFKEAGLPKGSVQTIQASAHLDATYQCVNRGGHNPKDPKKTTISQEVSQSGQFEAAKNGHLVGELTITAPAPTEALSCPGGQVSTLTAISWSNISVEDLGTGAFLAIEGSFSFGEPL